MIGASRVPLAAATLIRTFGLRGGLLRGIHEARRHSGAFRRRPRYEVPALPPQRHPFRVDPHRLAAAIEPSVGTHRGERVVAGEYQAYRSTWRRLPVDSAAWLNDPLDGRVVDPQPWWRVPHLGADGDIKDVWEPARFAWAYDLVRAYLLSGDQRFARVFHEQLSRWAESSPPFQGPHWSCGQETAVRAIALLYAEANLPKPAEPGDERLLPRILAASGERIADALGYAISQRNNHGISEAVGLIVLGARFRDVHPEAAQWFRRGKRWLERLVREQFANDGWYIQHSFTYMRLALDQCVVAQRVLMAVGDALSETATRRLRSAVELLGAVIDAANGRVPNHGANDGAFVHPITSAEYRDFRPSLTAACATFDFPLPHGIEPDAEVLAWLGATAPAVSKARPEGVRTGKSGWVAARVGPWFVFLRAGRYHSRPTHLDPLHMDVRFGSEEVVVDPGSYAYNGAPPWRNGLVSALVHNGPVVDEAEPGVRGPRFLWLTWPDAEVLGCTWDGSKAVVVAEIPGRVRRSLQLTAEEILVTDEVRGAEHREISVRWLLHPHADPGCIQVRGGAEVRAAREGATPGWFSPVYGERIASKYVEARRLRPAELNLVTHIRPPKTAMAAGG